MTVVISVILAVLAALSLACAIYYGVMLGRIRRALRDLPTLRDGLGAPPPPGGVWPSVCIVVPAHNEQAIIATLVRSLLTQDYPGTLRVIFALDRCTDDTQSVIAAASGGDPRIEILTVTACPDDWAGKVHAIWRGVCDATGSPSPREADFLLFTDADTAFAPECLRASVAMLLDRSLDMLSLLPTLTCTQRFEKVAQPAAGLELVRRFPLDRVNRSVHGARFANGQFMLFRRAAYEALGGHEAVHNELLEDLAFARRIQRPRSGLRLGVLMADGLLSCRMYPDYPAFRRGWKRIYVESAHCHAPPLRRWSRRVTLTGVVLPLGAGVTALLGLVTALGLWDWHGSRLDQWLGLAAIVLAKVGLTMFISAMREVYRSQKVPLRMLVLYPLGAWQVAGILREGAHDLERGVATLWGGRAYVREQREPRKQRGARKAARA